MKSVEQDVEQQLPSTQLRLDMIESSTHVAYLLRTPNENVL